MSEQAGAEQIRVETSEESPVLRTVRVEVPADRVRDAFDEVFRGLGQGAQVKGFRKGKVPRSVLERVYGPAAAAEVERLLVSSTLREALELADVSPVTEPDIDAEPPESGAPFGYSVRAEVKPPIELPELRGLPAKRPRVEIGDDEVDARIEALRESAAPLVEEDEEVAAAAGHTLDIDFEGRVGGELFEGGKGEDLVVELGSGRLIPGFEDQLVGAKAGEDTTVRVTFPEDYGDESLRGKEATFDVHVRSIRRKQLPELDDDFAKDVGEDTLDELRAKVRAELEQSAEREAKSVLHRSVVDSLLERCDFEAPPGLVERQLHSQLESMQRQFEGRVAPEVLRAELARMHEEGRESAERRVREALVLEAVAAQQGLEVESAAVDERLDQLAAAQGVDPRRIREMAEQQGWRAAIVAELLDARALDFLAAEANVEETTDT